MDKNKCKGGPTRCEVLGFILLLIATLLTIFTFNGLGILGMFFVGLALCCHHKFCRKGEQCCDVEHDEKCSTGTTTKSRAKKTS